MVDRPIFSEIAPFSPERDITRVWVGELLDYEDPITLPTLDRFALFERLAIDWQIYTCLQQRRRAVVRYRWEVEAGSRPGSDPSRLDKKAADFWRALLDAMPFDRLTDEALWAVWFGFGVAECNYAKDGQQVILDPSLGESGIYQGLKVRNRRRFAFHRTGGLRLLTPQNLLFGEPLPPRKFWVINVGATHSDNPQGQALAIACHRLATLRPEVWRERLRLLKKIAQGSIYGVYGQEEHAAALNQTIRALREGGGGSVPRGTELQELSLPTSTVADYAAMNQEIDEALAKLILGQVGTSEGVAGQHRGEMQHDVRQDLIISDSDLISSTFNAGPVTWLTEWNFPGATPPRVYRKIDAPPDQQAEADKDNKVWALGFAPTLERIEEVYGEGYVGAGPDNDLAAIPADRLPSILQIIDKVAGGSITVEQGRELMLYALPGITPEIAERLVQEPPQESSPEETISQFLGQPGGDSPADNAAEPPAPEQPATPPGDAAFAALAAHLAAQVESLEFATGKKCKKGWPCKNSCISKNKNCRSAVPKGLPTAYADWLLAQSKSSAVPVTSNRNSPDLPKNTEIGTASGIDSAYWDNALRAIEDEDNRENLGKFRRFIERNNVQVITYGRDYEDSTSPEQREAENTRILSSLVDRSASNSRWVFPPDSDAAGYTQISVNHIVLREHDVGSFDPERFKRNIRNSIETEDFLLGGYDDGGSNIKIFLHEMGHQVHFEAGSPQPPADLRGLSEYSRTNKFEYAAEHFVAWVVAPKAFRGKDQRGYNWISQMMEDALYAEE